MLAAWARFAYEQTYYATSRMIFSQLSINSFARRPQTIINLLDSKTLIAHDD